MDKLIRIHEMDNVAVATQPVAAGEAITVGAFSLTAAQEIPAGHKIALMPIAEGENIIKYGFPIGHAKRDIAAGEWVHTHNTASNLSGLREYSYQPVECPEGTETPATFMGYVRSDGSVGVRNEVWIIPTVGCVNGIAEAIEDNANAGRPADAPKAYAYTHPYGCSQLSVYAS